MNNGYIPYYGNGYFYFNPFIPQNCEEPPTVYAILNSIVNGKIENKENYHKIADLPKLGRTTIFNFEYPLSSHVSHETFETNILNHYLMRRIGTETVTAFRINLNAKLNEIMPLYNKMFDALDGWDIFEDGGITTRTGSDTTVTSSTNNRNTDSTTTRNEDSSSSRNNTNTSENSLKNDSTTSTNSTSDRRMSDTPQNNLQNVKDGKYITEYNFDTNNNSGTDSATSTGNSNSTFKENSLNSISNKNIEKIVEEIVNKINDNKNYNEKIIHSPENKIEIMKEFQQNLQSIYTMIYKDLDCLFYGLV